MRRALLVALVLLVAGCTSGHRSATRAGVSPGWIGPLHSENHGVRIGMKVKRVERLLHKRVLVGCGDLILLGKRNPSLTIGFAGAGGPSSAGDRVYSFALHGYRSDVGIFDCL